MSSVSQSESVYGNAEKPPRKQDNCQGKFWKVNYHLNKNGKTGESFESIFKLMEEVIFPEIGVAEYILGEEYGNSGKTPHVEGGFITREDRKRRSAIINVFPFHDCRKSKKAWWGKLVKYGLKEGNRIIHSEGVKVPKPLIKMNYDMLRTEQKEIVDKFREMEDPLFGRKVHWFWEGKGSWGKSLTCMYMIDHMKAFVVAGKNNDILCGITKHIEEQGECPPIVIFDIPRCNCGHTSYQAIENLKNGYFYSGKYESGMCRFNRPHIICFSNEKPEDHNLSSDRWIIEELIHK